MDNPDIDRNSAQYRGRIHYYFSRDEVRLTFCGYYEGNLVRTKASRRHLDGTVQSFQNFSHSLQRQSSVDCTRVFSANVTSYKEHNDQVSLLPEFCREWCRRYQTC